MSWARTFVFPARGLRGSRNPSKRSYAEQAGRGDRTERVACLGISRMPGCRRIGGRVDGSSREDWVQPGAVTWRSGGRKGQSGAKIRRDSNRCKIVRGTEAQRVARDGSEAGTRGGEGSETSVRAVSLFFFLG